MEVNMYKLFYSNEVIEKDIPKLSEPIKKRIKNAIEAKLLTDPVEFGKPLRYSLRGCRSLRVGDYRIIYQLMGQKINIAVIQHRKDCYVERKF